MNIFILGGCGYIGSVLVNKLLENKKIKIKVLDTIWFGNNLPKNKNLKVIKGDIRNLDKVSFKKVDALIHLANIANDPAVELDPNLSWNVNVLSTKIILDKAVKDKVKKIIYASSGSVYGIKKEKSVTENLDLKPISTYNKTKMIAERIILSYKDKLKIYCVRPATVCGLSPRMRFDVTVNILTLQALINKKIFVNGGSQIRPNIHIKDLVGVLEFFLFSKNAKTGIYNAGFENMSVLDIAKKIKKIIPSKILITKNKDLRSYRLNSNKLIKLGFKRNFYVEDAVREIKLLYDKGKLKASDKNYTVKWLKKLIKNDKVTL